MAFAVALTDYILREFSGKLAETVVFVPTARLAAQVRARLALEITGVLPAMLPLKGTGELADLLGFGVGNRVQPMAARVELFEVLKRIERGESDGVAGSGMTGQRLWQRADGLYRLLERLALHGIGIKELRRTVPEHLAGFWDLQAATLVAAGEHMERWLARRGEVLPCAAERRVLEQAAEILAREDCAWVPVVAGVVDGTPAAEAVAQVAARRGAVIVPDFGDAGPVTAGLAESWRTAVAGDGGNFVHLAVPCEGVIEEAMAASAWDEAWLAALGVRRAVEDGRRVAVVSPSVRLLERVSGLLEQWGLNVPVSGLRCLDRTPAGRAVLAVRNWGLHHGTPAHWLEAMRGTGSTGQRVNGSTEEDWVAVMEALALLAEIDAWLAHDDWQALMALALAETEAPAEPVSGGVALMRPLDARLLAFDTVIAAGAVEGVWPANGGDRWLSDAHLRALGMADTSKKAQLAGTEFESIVHGGSGHVLVARAKLVDGRETVPSRFVQGLQDYRVTGLQEQVRELTEAMAALRDAPHVQGSGLGVFRPEGALWPRTWSASFVEDLLACPYKAMGRRVLRLEEQEPLTPAPDARTAGLLAHRWLERIGTRYRVSGIGNRAAAVAELLEMGEAELQHEPAVVQAVWRAKFAKLAPALVDAWLANGRSVAEIEKRLVREAGPVTMTAKLDRVEQGASGAVIVDYKTSTPPSWASVASGERPQLALEAWLLEGEGTPVAEVEYWQLKGYGMAPLEVTRPGKKHSLETLLAPVAEGVARLAAAYGEGEDFVAVPDMAGGGLLATGHCARCALAGVCRRKEAGAQA